MAVQVINQFGHVADWGSVELVIFGRKIIGVSKIAYSQEQEVEAVYGAGHFPIGFGKGNQNCEVSITLLKEEMDGLQASLPAGKSLGDLPPTDVTVLYKRGGRIVKDVIRNFMITGRGIEVSQNDKGIWEEPPCWASHIEYDVR